jgi:hypothetical protein
MVSDKANQVRTERFLLLPDGRHQLRSAAFPTFCIYSFTSAFVVW